MPTAITTKAGSRALIYENCQCLKPVEISTYAVDKHKWEVCHYCAMRCCLEYFKRLLAAHETR